MKFDTMFRHPVMGFCLLLPVIAAVGGCDSNSQSNNGGKRQFVTLGSAPVGGAFAQVAKAIASVVNENHGEYTWRVQEAGTKGSKQNIRMLDNGEIQLGMSNAAISYHAVLGEGGWDKKYDIRAVATLAPNIGLFITKRDSGITSIAQLKGRRVTVGPSGAGFEMFLGPLLTEHGVTYTNDQQDFTPLNETYSAAVGLLGDGNADAAFLGGAIPTPAVTQACTTYDILFIPYDPVARDRLIEKYEFFQTATIPAKNKDGNQTYKGLEEDFIAMNVGSMQLITHANMDEELIYQITKTMWENRTDIAKQHRAGNAINEENVARNTGTPFHPGAIKFYKEIGIWRD